MTTLETKMYEVSNAHMINFKFELSGDLENLIETKKRARETFIRDEEVLKIFVEACNSDDIEFGYLRSYLSFILFEYEFLDVNQTTTYIIMKNVRELTEKGLDAKKWLIQKIEKLGGANYRHILNGDINLEYFDESQKIEWVGM